jgi:hypothetical protein
MTLTLLDLKSPWAPDKTVKTRPPLLSENKLLKCLDIANMSRPTYSLRSALSYTFSSTDARMSSVYCIVQYRRTGSVLDALQYRHADVSSVCSGLRPHTLATSLRSHRLVASGPSALHYRCTVVSSVCAENANCKIITRYAHPYRIPTCGTRANSRHQILHCFFYFTAALQRFYHCSTIVVLQLYFCSARARTRDTTRRCVK